MRPILFSRIVVRIWVGVVLVLPVASEAVAQPLTIRLDVLSGQYDRVNTPVVAALPIPSSAVVNSRVVLKDSRGQVVPAQLTVSGLLARSVGQEGRKRGTNVNAGAELHWILASQKAGATVRYTATVGPRPAGTLAVAEGYRWKDSPGRHIDLLQGKRPVVRYMYQAYENDPAKRDLNNKPFHHVFDPTGSRIVTKGTGGLYTHHQGLYYGFTRCQFPGGQCNTWYCHEGEHELHRQTLDQVKGPVMARHRTLIDWNDRQGKAFCREHRELAVFAVSPGGTLIEWSSRLWSVRGTVTLDGDSQHAGFQFRADNEVAERQQEKLVYFLRIDGKGVPGGTRNPVKGKAADDPANKGVVDQSWKVMSFVLGTQRYSAVYLDSPRNPGSSFASERAYGRFGGWFGKQKLVEGGKPLEIIYRVWLQRGEMVASEATRLSRDFVDPPRVVVSR
ncbi:MAG: hypothetical protein CMJ65_09830 [Planctomycetaceae bacterium]|nr:hypothetical protein [Planctomycetaceae bacterium]